MHRIHLLATIVMAACFLPGDACPGSPTPLPPKTPPVDPDRLGIKPLPEDAPAYLRREGFTKYTNVIAPNGKPIRIIAQAGVRDIAVARARNLLVFFLTDVPGSRHGASKADIANAMANNRAMLMMPEGAHREGNEPDLPAQPLYESETPVDGSRWYLENDWEHRDAGFEEIFHLVHDSGIGTFMPGARPEYQAELLAEAEAALEDGRWGIPIDPGVRHWIRELAEEDSLAQEYIASVIDSYYGLWAPFDERPGGMWGIYIAKTRKELLEKDPRGHALLESFLPPMMVGYEALIDPGFGGVFRMSLDPGRPWTSKSQYLVQARLTGSLDSGLAGNEADNILTGNRGNNTLDGRGGNDIAVFQGSRNEYTIEVADDGLVTVSDTIHDRDGVDELRSIEQLRFSDETRTMKAAKVEGKKPPSRTP